MKLGEIVETLICLRDRHRLMQSEDEAVCAACNILDKLPNMADEEDAKAWLASQEVSAG